MLRVLVASLIEERRYRPVVVLVIAVWWWIVGTHITHIYIYIYIEEAYGHEHEDARASRANVRWQRHGRPSFVWILSFSSDHLPDPPEEEEEK